MFIRYSKRVARRNDEANRRRLPAARAARFRCHPAKRFDRRRSCRRLGVADVCSFLGITCTATILRRLASRLAAAVGIDDLEQPPRPLVEIRAHGDRDVVAARIDWRSSCLGVGLLEPLADADQLERPEHFELGQLERGLDIALEEHVAADVVARGASRRAGSPGSHRESAIRGAYRGRPARGRSVSIASLIFLPAGRSTASGSKRRRTLLGAQPHRVEPAASKREDHRQRKLRHVTHALRAPSDRLRS